jgi:hypothetical protein
MKSVRSPKSWVRLSLPFVVAGLTATGSLLTLLYFSPNRSPSSSKKGPGQSIFATDYPALPTFEDERRALRRSGKLRPENEQLIQESITNVSTHLNMPPAILWCLLFQESRFDHLIGLREERSAYGLGQFSKFSFYEFNHQLDRFGAKNVAMVLDTMGKDIRPISPNRQDIYHYSSYYFIPTAVVASATYLNSRYFQLQRILETRGYRPNTDLLWIYAAMAYNKGTRSVLAFWNQVQHESGTAGVKRAVSDPQIFVDLTENSQLIRHSLARIWNEEQVPGYSQELLLHTRQIRECATEKWGEMQVSARPVGWDGR